MTALAPRAKALHVLLDGPAGLSEIRRRVSDKSEGRLKFLHSSSWNTLQFLVKRGFVTRDDQDRYHLTPEGRKLAEHQREVVTEFYKYGPKREETRSDTTKHITSKMR